MEIMSTEAFFSCTICTRKFKSQKGLESHRRQALGKCNDDEYKHTRNGNLISVHKFRTNKKNIPIANLLNYIENIKNETEKLENFLQERFKSLKFIKLKDKLNMNTD